MSYLDLQDIVTADSLVMHLVVGIVRVSARFILDKGEAGGPVSQVRASMNESLQSAGGGARGRNVAADQATIVLKLIGEIACTSAVTKAGDVEGGAGSCRHGEGK